MTRLIRSTVLSLVALALTATAALAWESPILESQCASSPESFAFVITLAEEENQRIELSYDIGFEHSVVIDFEIAGEHRFDIARPMLQGTTLYVRYESDHEAAASAVGNPEVCSNPVAPTPTPAPTANPTPTPEPNAPTATPAPLLPDTAVEAPSLTLAVGATVFFLALLVAVVILFFSARKVDR